MKRLLVFIVITIIALSCENQEIDFPDYDYNAVYFPIQYPVRTLVLGEDRIDNSRDKELKFLIGVMIGGMYENNDNWYIDFVIDNSLAENLVNANGDTLVALPAEYYNVTPSAQITIPKGSFKGTAEVQLNSNFLNDPLAITGNYVLPVRMTGTNADSMLTGLPLPSVVNPDKRRVTDWDVNSLPKDFVLFGIKYINPFHGDYFQRGRDIAYEPDMITPTDTVVYRAKYVEYDRIRSLRTTGLNNAVMNGIGRNVGGNFSISLFFEENGSIVVDSMANSPIKAWGNGEYLIDGDSWGGESRNAIHLDYQYYHNGSYHQILDTLVFRNNGVVYEENVITILEP